jgi:hypothetical protein
VDPVAQRAYLGTPETTVADVAEAGLDVLTVAALLHLSGWMETP